MAAPKFIESWIELKECESETHDLEIDLYYGNGWIHPKDEKIRYDEPVKNGYYLSTHTFYGLNHKRSTEVLQICGFNVVLKNWDEKTNKN